MADSSFDIVSKLDRQEVDNALGQAAREIATGSHELSRLTEEQASALAETAATAEVLAVVERYNAAREILRDLGRGPRPG